MTNNSKIRTTKQEWKLFSSFFGLLTCAGGMFYGINQMQVVGSLPVYIDLISIAAGMCVGIFACTSIRCPECRLKWVWHAVTKKEVNQWVPWLLSFEVCPRCESKSEKNAGDQTDV
ncbi:MAG: hypothetical protein PHI31_11560 [Desulfuromonadaceae bacterium]|nr:hypothetical protein [Desulfuromonadaceae bacterium]